jgi:adenosylhomocysteine nucleosidase
MISLGIIGAMDEEISLIKDSLEIVDEVNYASMNFYICKYVNFNVVLVRCGIGKVNAAICTQILIDKFNIDYVINTGVAGAVSRELDIGDVVISTDLVEHDFDTSSLGDELGQIPRMDVFSFKADEGLIQLAEAAGKKVMKGKNQIKAGRIVSGDQFISGEDTIKWLEKTFNPLAAEMEGAAIAHTCHVNKVPFVVIRSISDRADKGASVDFTEFLHIACKTSFDIIMYILNSIKQGVEISDKGNL